MKHFRITRLLLLPFITIIGTMGLLGSHAFAATATITVASYQNIPGWHITSSPAGIDCTSGSGTCTFDFPPGTSVALTATPPSGREIHYWGGGTCQEDNSNAKRRSTCTLTPNYGIAETITAYWEWTTYNVQTAVRGTGKGTVTSSPAGLNCPTACQKSFNAAQSITLTATPAAGSTFSGWGTYNDGALSCFTGGGIGGSMARGTSRTCTITAGDLDFIDSQTVMSGVAFFDSTATAPTASGSSNSKTPAPTSTAPGPTPSTSSTTTQPTDQTASTTPGLSNVEVNGATLPASTGTKPSFSADTGVKLQGKTTPGATVTLYIFSTPRTATVKADKDGNWSYSIKDLPAGDHHVEYTVTDPTTHTVSSRSQLLAFRLTAATTAPQTATSATKHTSGSAMLAILLCVVALAAVVAGLVWRLKRRSAAS